MKLLERIGFKDNKGLIAFLTVVMSGQIIYSSFEAFKGAFYTTMLEFLGVSNTEMGLLFTLIGSAMFFYVPAGWVNNRFPIRNILIGGMGFRLVTMLFIIFFQPPFKVLAVIAGSWGILDAIFWPAVVNGVALFSGKHNKGIAFGLLESVRRSAEAGMNAAVVAVMAAMGGAMLIFKSATLIYTLLIIPMIILVWIYVPHNKIGGEDTGNQNKEALKGLIAVLKIPSVWYAAITALTVYWGYIQLVYTVPYLQAVFGLTTAQAAMFGIINTSAMSIFAGIISGSISDFVFKSSSKMMMVALGLTALSLAITVFLPKSQGMLTVNIVCLMCFSFSVFLAKGIILAPIAEVKIPEEYSGAAMSVGSFAAYASIFWAYGLNGYIIDTHEAVTAYQMIFGIGIAVATLGAFCAVMLLRSIAKSNEELN